MKTIREKYKPATHVRVSFNFILNNRENGGTFTSRELEKMAGIHIQDIANKLNGDILDYATIETNKSCRNKGKWKKIHRV